MFIAVVIVFAICWLPYHLYFIFTYHFNELTKSPMVQHVYLGFYWLAMSNSMFNPFVYYWMNSRYVHDISLNYTYHLNNKFINRKKIILNLICVLFAGFEVTSRHCSYPSRWLVAIQNVY